MIDRIEDSISYLEILKTYRTSDTLAYIGKEQKLSYRELMLYSDRLANYLVSHYGVNNEDPIVVYGHKDMLMPICFLACTKSGHPYCPIDISFTAARVKDVMRTANPPITLLTEELQVNLGSPVLTKDMILEIIQDSRYDTDQNELPGLNDEDTVYIIFTSGSTGKPKGVQISFGNLNNYVKWMYQVVGAQNNKRYLNQAPFSFDLSVMDLYLSLYSESTLYTISSEDQEDYNLLYKRLQQSHVTNWVSTPSFIDLCLSFKEFNCQCVGNIEYFLFCGEILTKKTARRLKERFPHAKVINTYGPTESTVCVTHIELNEEVLHKYSAVPLGRVKQGSRIEIRDGDRILEEGEAGEIVIIGNTVGKGYYKNPELNKSSFFQTTDELRGYRTGDIGYLLDGNLFFLNRLDSQVKLHGYRIELGDIEHNLSDIEGVLSCCVVPSLDSDGKVKNLVAAIVCQQGIDEKAYTYFLKQELRKVLPDYMIPRHFKFVDHMPMNSNGKVDRGALSHLLEGSR